MPVQRFGAMGQPPSEFDRYMSVLGQGASARHLESVMCRGLVPFEGDVPAELERLNRVGLTRLMQ
jgi:hypothetical protein